MTKRVTGPDFTVCLAAAAVLHGGALAAFVPSPTEKDDTPPPVLNLELASLDNTPSEPGPTTPVVEQTIDEPPPEAIEEPPEPDIPDLPETPPLPEPPLEEPLPEPLPEPEPEPEPEVVEDVSERLFSEVQRPRRKPRPPRPQTVTPPPQAPPQQVVQTPPPRPQVRTTQRRTAPPAAPPRPAAPARDQASIDQYGEGLFRKINRNAARSYPRRSMERREEGVVPVRLKVGPAGQLLSVRILDESLASSRLVRAAVRAVERSAPFPAFQSGMGAEPVEFDIRVIYVLR